MARLLCLETSAREGSLAIFEGEKLLGEAALAAPARTAQSFAPALRELVERQGWRFDQLDRVAVATGPGSFTGLRIGVTAAKTLAYVTGADLLGVNTLEAIAWRAFRESPTTMPSDARLWAVIDAQRAQLFAAQFVADESSELGFRAVEPTRIVEIEAWRAELAPEDHVTGPGLSRVGEQFPANVHALETTQWSPTATSVGRIATTQFAVGRADDPFQLVPNYFRLSAAEEKRDADDAAANP